MAYRLLELLARLLSTSKGRFLAIFVLQIPLYLSRHPEQFLQEPIKNLFWVATTAAIFSAIIDLRSLRERRMSHDDVAPRGSMPE